MKSEEEGGTMDEILKAILETDLQNEAEVEKVLKAANLSDKAQAAVRNTLKILNAYKDELPGDILKTLAELAGYGYPAPAEKAKDGDEKKAPAEKANEEEKKKKKPGEYGYGYPVKKADGSWDLSKVPEELRPSFETIFKEHEELVKKAAEAEQKAAATEAVLKAERDERLRKEWIAKAAEYKHLPAKPEEFGLVLKALSEKAPEELAKLEQVLKAADEQIGQGALFKEVGSGAAPVGGTAWAKIEAAANALVQKDDKLTHEQAIRKAIELHPELYEEHVKEMRGK
jgi:hypothetical protein